MEGGNHFGWILGAFTAIVGLAMVAILVSQKAQTSAVFQALASGGSQVLGTALSPITGATTASNGLGSSGGVASAFTPQGVVAP
jgi:hypothetical protein